MFPAGKRFPEHRISGQSAFHEGVRGDRRTPTKLNIAKNIPTKKIQVTRFICPNKREYGDIKKYGIVCLEKISWLGSRKQEGGNYNNQRKRWITAIKILVRMR